MSLVFHHRLARPDLALGLVRAEGLSAGAAPPALAAALDRCIAERAGRPLDAGEEARCRGGRDVLRNGRYKPTGRGKPASEYLLRAAAEGAFPRVSGPVDANNLVSLAHLVPISVWDLDLAASAEYELRLGRAGESYVFNPAGQVLELEDLACGCALDPGGGSRAIVTPVKDGLATKIRPASRRIAGCIYYPLAAGSAAHLEQTTQELLDWLLACGEGATGARAVALPGQTVTV